MAKGAVLNPDRARSLRPVAIPPSIAQLLKPGSRAFRMGRCQIIVSQQLAGWHLSISRPDRLPTWEEVRDARYALVPDEATMALLLPPRVEYVNVHDYCLQLYEIPGEYIAERQDRVTPKPHLPRNRGEAAAVDGLTAVGQEDTPKR